MTKLLEKVLKQVSTMPEEQQDALAKLILGEIEDEKQWTSSLARSSGTLRSLAEEALDEHRSGKTEDLDPDKL